MKAVSEVYETDHSDVKKRGQTMTKKEILDAIQFINGDMIEGE